MAEDRPDDSEPSPDSGRAKRAPPTIDLEATEISGETQNAGAGAEPKRSLRWPSRAAISSAVVAAVSGAGAAALVIGMAWLLGWPGEVPQPTATPQANDAIDALASRIAGIEAKLAKPPASAPDPAVASRIEALEKSYASLRGELAGVRAQSKELAAAVNDVKSTPGESSPPVDLSAINERIAQVERAARAQVSETTQESTKPADDLPLRRLVAAALLDVSVRHGDPYTAALAAAKSLTADADALKPLDGFAASGVPSANALSRELLTLVPKLSPSVPENSTTGSSLVDRLQAGASKLVRIQRTDALGNDRSALVARITAAALRNDMAEARRELNTLPPADRAAAQPWLDKADARDAALAASRQFATEAMAALAQPRQ
ncbi:MAG TPA: hypothetical protein VGH62_14005 [Bradyrhizobium sp.]|jgi:hypothetical protein